MSFISYRRFFSPEQASELIQLLEKHEIPFELECDSEPFKDDIYGQRLLQKDFMVKIRQEDFERVNGLIEEQVQLTLGETNEEHYLYGFTDAELFEIVTRPDEWNEFDFLLARKILKERGKEIDDYMITLLKQQRLQELAKPQDSVRMLIIAGYLFALLGGPLGMVIGWHLSTARKKLPNGRVMLAYSEMDRNQGVIIFFTGIFFFTLAIIASIYGFK